MKIIKTNKVALKSCFWKKKYYTFTILTYLFEYKFLFWKLYKIKQVYPKLKDPYYDGDYGTISEIKLTLDEQKNLMTLHKYRDNE